MWSDFVLTSTLLVAPPPRPRQVWHNVSVSPQKARRKKADGQSPRAITLAAEETSERFAAQPPVRPAVLFASDPAHEVVQVGTT